MDYWIAVVDDEALSLSNAKILLNGQGMKVSCLRSGQALLKYMENHEPDLILLDIMMPEMDGFETFQALRRQEEEMGRNRTPVIFLTGENDADIERRGLNAGASDFIHKPFNQEILVSRISNTIINNRKIESLTEEAKTDKLTGFLNKSSGTAKIESMCQDQTGSMMVFDLDNFKLVNDLFGHDMGDRVLEAFADIIRHNTRSNDVVSRIGGDEFLAFFSGLLGEEAVAGLTSRLNEQLLKKCTSLMGEDFGIPIGISVGAVFIPEHGTDFHTLFQYADNSLYTVKQNGKHGCDIYDPETYRNDFREDTEKELARVTKLVEERGSGKGAMLLGQDVFSSDYRLIMRLMKRFRGSVTKYLFSVNAKEQGQDISAAVTCFAGLLQEHLRSSDIIFQNRPNQFFLVFTDLSEDTRPDIGRILTLWKEKEYSEQVDIHYTSEIISFGNREA